MRLKNLLASLFFALAVVIGMTGGCAQAEIVSHWKSFVVTEASSSTIYTAPANGTFIITNISISGGKFANDNTVVTVLAAVNDVTPAPIFSAAAIPGTGGGLNGNLGGQVQLQVPSGGTITYETINSPLFRLNIIGVEYIDTDL